MNRADTGQQSATPCPFDLMHALFGVLRAAPAPRARTTQASPLVVTVSVDPISPRGRFSCRFDPPPPTAASTTAAPGPRSTKVWRGPSPGRSWSTRRPIQVNPYLSFKSHARESMEFYRTVFGGAFAMQTFGEGHASQDPIESRLIMHAELKGDHGIVFMASDTPSHMEFKPGSNISMSVSGDDEAALTSYFEKLSPGAAVTMPLSKAPWGDTFGMLTDKYGIAWSVNIAGQRA